MSSNDLVIQARQFLGINEIQSKKNSLVLKNESQINPLQQLYQLLIDPILEFLPSDLTDLIVFIPQGNLFLLPFAALQNAEEKFFIEQHTIVTIPSIQILDLLGDKENSVKVVEEEISALLVGNPQKMPVLPLIEPPQQLKNLPWAESEVNAIASLLNTKAITGKNATKVEILKQMPKANIIHLATHGLLDDIRQLGIPGAIAFASSDDNETDGFLTSGEIYNLKLNAQLVVLSACRTGQGEITGDGIIGLSRCLIAAGVKSVIVSLWNVGDRSTALLMLKFYQFFQQGITPTLALNQAQRWLLKIKKQELEAWVLENSQFFDPTLKINLKRKLRQLKDNESPFESPCHWAAFCIIGH